MRRAADLDPELDLLFELHAQRWHAAGQQGVFADARRRAFFRDFAFQALQRGWLRLYALRIADRTVAMQIGYVHDGQFLQVQEGFAAEDGLPAPGVTLRAAIMRDCISEGLRGYDNLLGTPPHKMRWGAVPRPVHRLLLAPRWRLGGLMMRVQDHLVRRPGRASAEEV